MHFEIIVFCVGLDEGSKKMKAKPVANLMFTANVILRLPYVLLDAIAR